jgi:hypothetical protein
MLLPAGVARAGAAAAVVLQLAAASVTCLPNTTYLHSALCAVDKNHCLQAGRKQQRL